MMQDVHMQSNPGLPWQKQHSIWEDSFYQWLGLKFKAQTKQCYIRSIAQHGAETWTLENRLEITWKIWNVVLEKDGRN